MGQSEDLEWRDGQVPVALRFDDPYFSLTDGLAETRHVFLAGNDLPARFQSGFQIAELGFGTGLNLLASWQLWRQTGQSGKLHFTSFEAFPLTLEDMEQALSAFPELAELAGQMLAGLDQSALGFETEDLRFDMIQGDARCTLPNWAGAADAWFLDGFSPAKNPELWEPDLMMEVGKHTRLGGSCATYTAAGHVRRALQAAGFAVERVPGFGRKRHMTVGALPR